MSACSAARGGCETKAGGAVDELKSDSFCRAAFYGRSLVAI